MSMIDAIAPGRTHYERALDQQDRDYSQSRECPEEWPRSNLSMALENIRQINYIPPTPEQKKAQRDALDSLFDTFAVKWAEEKQTGWKW